MSIEIERKFLVQKHLWKPPAEGVRMRQGYLCVGPPAAIRVRVIGENAVLNIKQATDSIVRREYEYPLPCAEANELLDTLCAGSIIDKTRYTLPVGNLAWEVDVFYGLNEGLVVAEIELQDENQSFEKPIWLGREVSQELRYFNAHLALHPYTTWNL